MQFCPGRGQYAHEPWHCHRFSTGVRLASRSRAKYSGNETVNNFGVVTGNVGLGPGANAFNNMAGAPFNSGVTVVLSAPAISSPITARCRRAAPVTGFTTALTGDFAQPGSETRRQSSGRRCRPPRCQRQRHTGGQVKPLFTLSGLGSFTQWTVLNSGTPIVNNGIEAVDTAAVDFDLIFPPYADGPGAARRRLRARWPQQERDRHRQQSDQDLRRRQRRSVKLLDALAALPNIGDLATRSISSRPRPISTARSPRCSRASPSPIR